MEEKFVLFSSFPPGKRELLIDGIFSVLEEGMPEGEELDIRKKTGFLMILRKWGIPEDLVPQIFLEMKKIEDEWKERRSIFFVFRKDEVMSWHSFANALNFPLYFSLPKNHKKGERTSLVTTPSTSRPWIVELLFQVYNPPSLSVYLKSRGMERFLGMETLYVGTFLPIPFSQTSREKDVFFVFEGQFEEIEHAKKLVVFDELHFVGIDRFGWGRGTLFMEAKRFSKRVRVDSKPDADIFEFSVLNTKHVELLKGEVTSSKAFRLRPGTTYYQHFPKPYVFITVSDMEIKSRDLRRQTFLPSQKEEEINFI